MEAHFCILHLSFNLNCLSNILSFLLVKRNTNIGVWRLILRRSSNPHWLLCPSVWLWARWAPIALRKPFIYNFLFFSFSSCFLYFFATCYLGTFDFLTSSLKMLFFPGLKEVTNSQTINRPQKHRWANQSSGMCTWITPITIINFYAYLKEIL